MPSSKIVNGDESFSSSATTELDDTVELKKVNRPDLIEIKDAFDNLELNPILKTVAETNQLVITWQDLQQILDALIKKQTAIMEDKITDEKTKKDAEDLASKISHSINNHSNCPFTIQRLCELVIQPKKYYKMYIKYLRAVQKVLLVTSSWEDFAHSNHKDQVEEESIPGENSLSSFNNCIELEPHHFEVGEQMEGGDKEKVTDQIDEEEAKEEIKKKLKKQPIQVNDGSVKKAKKDDTEEKDFGMKNKHNSEQEDTVVEKVDFSIPADANENDKMDLD